MITTSKKRSYNMSRIKNKDTKIEVDLRRALWKEGLRYTKNDIRVFGKPDICFHKKKLAVFCDSSFWHGRDYLKGKIPKSNKKFWIEKFKNNINRDKNVNEKLKKEGWKIIRFWDDEIIYDIENCVKSIKSQLG